MSENGSIYEMRSTNALIRYNTLQYNEQSQGWLEPVLFTLLGKSSNQFVTALNTHPSTPTHTHTFTNTQSLRSIHTHTTHTPTRTHTYTRSNEKRDNCMINCDKFSSPKDVRFVPPPSPTD